MRQDDDVQASKDPTPRRRQVAGALAAMAALAAAGPLACPAAQAAASGDAVGSLRAFVREARSGQARFTQVVTSPDGARRKTSQGQFEFQRPGRFRFTYTQPYAQTIVSDGAKVWFHDPDLNQVTVRRMGEALGSTPAALLAGQDLERDFELQALPDAEGLAWVQATPRDKGGTVQSLRVGFQGRALAALEILDSFGQRSRLQFTDLRLDVALPADTFRFTPPPGADVTGA